jgi:1-acyl-sn-glycerol-3-phosphate acyltransferase
LIRTALLVVFYVAVIVLITPVILFCMLVGLRDPLIAIGQWVMRLSRRILGITIEVAGVERLDPRSPCVYMPNHASFIDGPLVMVLIPGVARVILKKSVLRIPVVGMGMRHVGFVPVDRKGAEGGKKSIARAVRLMRTRGYSFLIFPEGTRSRDGRLGRFRRGGFFLALESGAPIVPVTIQGTHEIMPKKQWFSRRGTVKVVFHEPVAVTGYTPETMSGLMEKVRAAILSVDAAGSGGTAVRTASEGREEAGSRGGRRS